RSPERKRFLASCIVMVDPPKTTRPRSALRSNAAPIADQSTPRCSLKRASSDAITARLRWSEIASYGTHWNSIFASGFLARRRSSSARMKAVDPGSTWVHHSTWPKYQNCRATNAVAIAVNVQARPRRIARPMPLPPGRRRVASGARRLPGLAGRRAIGSAAPGDARADRGEDFRRRRANAAPQGEGLRGLLHEHAQAVARLGAAAGKRILHEARRPRPVHHVVREPDAGPEA